MKKETKNHLVCAGLWACAAVLNTVAKRPWWLIAMQAAIAGMELAEIYHVKAAVAENK